MLGLALMLGGGEIHQFFLRHGFFHAFRGAFQVFLFGVAALGGQSRTGGLLLCFRDCWHFENSLLVTATSAPAYPTDMQRWKFRKSRADVNRVEPQPVAAGCC